MRFTDFLRTAVLLSAASASALAVVAIAGAVSRDEPAVIYIGIGWWVVATLIGVWVGRHRTTTAGIARLMAGARASQALPELEPGTVLFNRLWPLATATVVAGAFAFLFPQVPAIATGYGLLWAMAWRRQEPAVAAVEFRDGVRFYVDRTSPFKPTQLIRTPGFSSPQHEEKLERARS